MYSLSNGAQIKNPNGKRVLNDNGYISSFYYQFKDFLIQLKTIPIHKLVLYTYLVKWELHLLWKNPTICKNG